MSVRPKPSLKVVHAESPAADPAPSPAHQRLIEAKAARQITVDRERQAADRLTGAHAALAAQESAGAAHGSADADGALAERVHAWLHAGAQGEAPTLDPGAAQARVDAEQKVSAARVLADEIRRQLPSLESTHALALDALRRSETAIKQAALAIIEEDARRLADEIDAHVAAIHPLRQRLAGAVIALQAADFDSTATGQYAQTFTTGVPPVEIISHPKLDALRNRLRVVVPKIELSDPDYQQHATAFRKQLNQLIAGDPAATITQENS
jgi:hypothetical protein